MASTEESFKITQARQAEAARERARALQMAGEMCANGKRHLVIRFLLANMRRQPALRQIRLWQLDAIIFGASRKRACKTIRLMRRTIGDASTVKDGYATLGWATENEAASVRMSTWLWLLLLREKLATFDLPDGFPYGILYDTTTDTQGGER